MKKNKTLLNLKKLETSFKAIKKKTIPKQQRKNLKKFLKRKKKLKSKKPAINNFYKNLVKFLQIRLRQNKMAQKQNKKQKVWLMQKFLLRTQISNIALCAEKN